MARAPVDRALFLAVLLLAAAACSPAEKDCPNDLPATCPDSDPSFQTQVFPIVQNRCYPCHNTGGEAAAKHLFTSYTKVLGQRREMLNQLYACNMPPEEADQPTDEERALLLAWFVCGAKNN